VKIIPAMPFEGNKPSFPVLEADLSGRTVLVIGANAGIGIEAARHFARMSPRRLICTARTEEKCIQTVENIRKDTGFKDVECWPLELSSFASVIAFADRFEKDGGQLDILVANAAMALFDYSQTPDGHETSLQVNHLSGALLVLRLLPTLLKTAEKNGTVSRIVVVSSGTHAWSKFDYSRIPRDASVLETLSSKEFSTPTVMKARYPDSKLLNVLFVREFQAQLPPSSPLVVNAVDPGFCDSGLRRYVDVGQFDEDLKKARTSEEGSRQLIFASVGPNPKELDSGLDVFKGAYIASNEVEPPSSWVRTEEGSEVQGKVWKETLNLLSKVDSRLVRVQDIFQH